MTPGTHGTTFGGTPFVCTSGNAVIDIINRERLLDNVNTVSEAWIGDLRALRSDRITDIRGKGFLIGVEMDSEETAAAVRQQMLSSNILVNVCHGKVVRIMPPLIFSAEQEKVWMDSFARALSDRGPREVRHARMDGSAMPRAVTPRNFSMRSRTSSSDISRYSVQ